MKNEKFPTKEYTECGEITIETVVGAMEVKLGPWFCSSLGPSKWASSSSLSIFFLLASEIG